MNNTLNENKLTAQGNAPEIETPTMQTVYEKLWDARATAWKAHYDNAALNPLSHCRLLRAIEQINFAFEILTGKSTKTEIELGYSLK